MEAWLVWLIVAAIATVGEILTLGFFLAPFAAGSLVGFVAALAGAGAAVQLILFALVTLLCFALLRPVARRHLRQPAQTRTNTAALIGRTAVVLEPIVNDEAVGTVRLDGEVWTARSYDADETIEAGTRVQVVEIRGATALVSP
jgi:membrane protein implicated in regulation of membrane protease activity